MYKLNTICENQNDNLVTLVDYRNNKTLNEYGVSCHWWSLDATSMHTHNFYEFFIVTAGEAIHEINGKRKKLYKGMLQLIHPNDKHRIISSPSKKCTHINISITVDKLTQLCKTINVNIDDLNKNSIEPINLSVNELGHFLKRAERLSLLMFNNDEYFVTLIHGIIVESICLFCNNSVHSQLNMPDYLTETLEKLHSPKYYGCCANDVYNLMGFSPPVVIEIFKKHTGLTVAQYLRQTKLNIACELLESTNMSIIEISSLMGYSSLSHFSRVFKEILGITPAAYRKSKK